MRFNLKSAKAVFMALCISLSSSAVAMADNLYSEKETEIITKGVTYGYEHRLATDGWQNIHTITVDLNSDNVKIAPVESSSEYGLKETVLKMLTDKGAAAGVNADFFGLKGEYSASFGPVINDGELISVGTDKNLTDTEYASFFMSDAGKNFIDYLRFTADFVNDRGGRLELASINKITELVYPMYLSNAAMPSTLSLDRRISDLVKIVVENDTITYISTPGEIIDCPKGDGYIIIVKGSYATQAQQMFKVGDHVQTKINSNIDLNSINMAIGGAGRILLNGAVVNDGVAPGGRQPRTALGISADQSKLILMVVDGRGKSIGATHNEMAQLMKEYGAYNAMHLDGGGSSTMVAETINDDKLNVKNTVSDGSQRKVMNAIGVFNTSTPGAVTELKITPSSERAFVGEVVKLNTVAFDKYYNKIPVNANEIQYSVISGNGRIAGNTLAMEYPGTVEVMASYNGISATAKVEFSYPSAMTPKVSSVSMQPGETVAFSFTGMDDQGYSAPITNKISYMLSDDSLGTINPSNGTFTAAKNGTGYVTAICGTAICHIEILIGGSMKTVESFENGAAMKFSSYPSNVTGKAGVMGIASQGIRGLQLIYKFAESNETQAAYANFENPVEFKGTPDTITMSVKGNGTDQWLRGRIEDADGKVHIIDFSKNLNWTGWKDVTAQIPKGVTYPIKLDTIYVAALSNKITTDQTVSFDNIRAVVVDGVSNVPVNPPFIDKQNVGIDHKVAGSYYVTLAGNVVYNGVKPAQYTDARVKVNNALQQNSDLMIFAGGNDISAPSSVKTMTYGSGYKVNNLSYANLTIVEMSAKNGGLRKTNPSQWQKFTNDVAAANNENVIFIMDVSPSNFDDKLEGDLLKNAFTDIKDTGKNVYVISASGYSNWNTVKDGVRYINLPSLWTADGKLNNGYQTLTIKVDANSMCFDLKPVF